LTIPHAVYTPFAPHEPGNNWKKKVHLAIGNVSMSG